MELVLYISDCINPSIAVIIPVRKEGGVLVSLFSWFHFYNVEFRRRDIITLSWCCFACKEVSFGLVLQLHICIIPENWWWCYITRDIPVFNKIIIVQVGGEIVNPPIFFPKLAPVKIKSKSIVHSFIKVVIIEVIFWTDTDVSECGALFS